MEFYGTERERTNEDASLINLKRILYDAANGFNSTALAIGYILKDLTLNDSFFIFDAEYSHLSGKGYHFDRFVEW